MSQENIQVVGNLYEAYARKDINTIFEILDPRIEIYQSDLLP